MSDFEPKGNEPGLSPADAAAMDEILDGEADEAVDPHRRARVMAWLKTAGASPMPEAPADLTARTLAAVQADRMRLPVAASAVPDAALLKARTRSVWRRRLAEFGSMAVAAGLLIAVTVAGLGQVKRSQGRMACMKNLQQVGAAFDMYAADFVGELPMLALPENRNYLHGSGEGAARTNTSNLLPLLNGYTTAAAFYCPGAESAPARPPEPKLALANIGYSYRNLYGDERPQWDDEEENIILTDRNPLFAGEGTTSETRNSGNHQRQGNYVLRASGNVTWEATPFAGPGRDNIWTVAGGAAGKTQGTSRYNGSEVPASLRDVFVGP